MNYSIIPALYVFLFRIMLPDDGNPLNVVHGGVVLQIIDEAGFLCSTKYCNNVPEKVGYWKKLFFFNEYLQSIRDLLNTVHQNMFQHFAIVIYSCIVLVACSVECFVNEVHRKL